MQPTVGVAPAAQSRSAGNTVLSVRGLFKSFGPVAALDDVSLDLAVGEIRAICGENGAGKSTLVKILTGVVAPDAGSVSVDGRECRLSSPREAQQYGLALVSQELSVCPDLSVLDNIWLGSAKVPLFHKRMRLRERAREALAMLGAEHIDLDQPVMALGTGERQLVEIARMLTRDARILILDEPTATLSDNEIERILAALVALKSEGRSVLYITHRLAEVFQVCDTATILRNGKLVASHPVANLRREDLIELMLGRPFVEMYPQHHFVAGDSALTIKNLTIPGVVSDVNLVVPRGDTVCIAGQVGSGAEGIVRAVAGLVYDARGEIHVGGARMPLGRPDQSHRQGVRYVSGDRAKEGIFLDQRVVTNLTATRLPQRSRVGLINPWLLKNEAVVLAKKIGVDERRLHSFARQLSGGNQQKLAFGRCVDDGSPGVIVMVEPTRGIDVGARADIYRLMRSFCDHGYGLLVASTDFAEVLGLGDVIVTMYRGRQVRSYQSDELTMQQLIVDVTHPTL